MALYSVLQISQSYGASESTTRRHINALKKKKRFKKTSVGSGYNEKDLKTLQDLLGFTFKNGMEKKTV